MRYATLKPLVLWLKRKKILNLFTKQKQTHRQKTLIITRVGHGGKQTHTAVCKIGKQQESTAQYRNYTQHLVVTHDGKNLKKNICICIYVCVCVQLCSTLCDPMDCNLPGSSVHGIFQARILERVAISYARGSFWPRERTRVSGISCIDRWISFLPLCHLESPYIYRYN